MREIKFRAWDKERNRMLEFGLFDLDCGQWDTEIGSINDFPIMQYTGLKDKKGKEIYEGDIVKSRGYNDINEEERVFIETVEFNGGEFLPICEEPSENYEVIGNIYENPELLKTA
jgi:hypothetical protein